MNVFVSMPMNGLSDEEIHRQFEKVEAYIRYRDGLIMTGPINGFRKVPASEIHVIDTTDVVDPPEKANRPVHYIGQSLIKLSMAEAVLFWPDWRNHRGCEIEHLAAERYNIPTMTIEDEFLSWSPTVIPDGVTLS